MNYIEMPRLNANEDETKLVKNKIKSGEFVEKGNVIFEVESTKASFEVIAEKTGYFLLNENIEEGQQYQAGFYLGLISPTAIDNTAEASAKYFKGQAIETETKNLKKSILAESKSKNKRVVTNEAKYGRRSFIIGAGRHATQVADACISAGIDVLGFIDNDTKAGTEVYRGIQCVGDDNQLIQLIKTHKVSEVINGIGLLNNPIKRYEILRGIEDKVEIPFGTVVCKTAIVSPSCEIESGVVILSGCIIGANVKIGNFTIVNQGVNISHDTNIGRNCNLAPGCILAGSVSVGDHCLLGMGSTIYTGVNISENIIVDNGQNVFNNI